MMLLELLLLPATLAALALLPLALLLRGRSRARGRAGAALDLHRAQLVELDRDLADKRIGAADHAAAVLEVQRRALAVREEAAPRTSSALPVLAVLVLVPVASLGLYLVGGRPGMPDMPLSERRAAMQSRIAQAAALEIQLRATLDRTDPASDQARQGFVLLGGLLAEQGKEREASSAWRRALAVRFDATLAVKAAEALARAEGRVSPDSAALFRRALDAGLPDPQWRGLAEERLREAS